MIPSCLSTWHLKIYIWFFSYNLSLSNKCPFWSEHIWSLATPGFTTKFSPIWPLKAKVRKWYHVPRNAVKTNACWSDRIFGQGGTSGPCEPQARRFWRCSFPKRARGSHFAEDEVRLPETNSEFTPQNQWFGRWTFLLWPCGYFQGLLLLVSGSVSQQVKLVISLHILPKVWWSWDLFLFTWNHGYSTNPP